MKLNAELFEYSNNITWAVFYLIEDLNHYRMFVSKVFKQVPVWS